MPHQPQQRDYRHKSGSSLPRPQFPHLGAAIVKPPPIVSFHTPTHKPTTAANTNRAASATHMAALTSIANTPASYKPPQHKHAHHLHSIPPREKTTKTLILDNMLWLHSRARFDQAAAELAGVDVEEQGTMGKEREIQRDVTTAKSLKARADGLEKVLSAMLDQPAEEVPWDTDDIFFGNDTAMATATNAQLPNGIRMRIALARLVNDLYAQDSDLPSSDAVAPAPYLPAPPAFASLTPALSWLSRISCFATYQKESQLPKLPSFHTFTATASGVGGSAPPAHSLLPPPPAGSIFSTIPRGAGAEAPWALGRGTTGTSANTHPPTRDLYSTGSSSSGSLTANGTLMPPPAPPRVFRAVGRAKDLYNGGVNVYLTRQSEAQPGMTPTIRLRCPHHLTFTCPPSSFCSHVPPSTLDDSEVQVQTKRARSNIGSGLGKAGNPLRGASKTAPDANVGLAGSSGPASMTELIPRFLRLSASVAIELGREAREAAMADEVSKREGNREGVDTEDEDDEGMRTPRAYGKGKQSGRRRRTASTSRSLAAAALPTREWYNLLVSFLTRATLQGYLQKGWRGTDPVEILLGVGVGKPPPDLDELAEDDVSATESSKDQNFMPNEWPNLAETWSVLFGSGMRFDLVNGKGKAPAPYDDTTRYYGSYTDSARVPKRPAYAEFERTMADRITDFLTLPHHDLATYLDFFSRVKYKQENVDKEALRFFEAVANWRGEPELETMKRQSASATASPAASTAAATAEAGPAPSTPTAEPSTDGATEATAGPSDADSARPSSPSASPAPMAAPSIYTYFTVPPSSVLLTPTRRSRRRGSSASSSVPPMTQHKRKDRSPESSPDDGDSDREPSAKKLAVPAWGHGRAWMEPDEYVGPYGI